MPSSDTYLRSKGSTDAPKPFEGQTNTVYAVAYSPDGTQIASGGGDNTVRIWDSDTGMQIGKPLKGHKDDIIVVAFSPDGQKIASSSDDYSVRIWDASTQEPVLGSLLGHTDYVGSVEYSPDGHLIATASQDRSIRLWAANSGAWTTSLWHPHTVARATFSPCGKHIASACLDKLIRVWDITSRTLIIPPLAAHTDEVWVVAYSRDGHILASGGRDSTICLWDAQTWKLRRAPLEGHTLAVSDLAFTPDGQILISASRDRSVRAWAVLTGDCLWGPIYSDDFLRRISVSPTKYAVVYGKGSSMCIRDVVSGKLILPEGPESKLSKGQPMVALECTKSLVWFPNDTRFASSGSDRTIQIWNAKRSEYPIGEFSHPAYHICVIDISPDGSMLVSGSDNRSICLWNTNTKALVMSPIRGHTDAITAIKFTPDASRLISASADRTIRVWDARTGLSIRVIEGHDRSVDALSVSADGSKLASGSEDCTVRVWDIQTGSLIAGPYKHVYDVLSVCWSPDETCILSSSWSTAQVWNISSGEQLFRVVHWGWVHCVQYAPDGKTFLSSSEDKTLCIWDTSIGKLLRSLEHESPVFSAAFSRDGTRIASGTVDGYIRVWDPASGKITLGQGSEDDKGGDESDREAERAVQRKRRALASDESSATLPATTRKQGLARSGPRSAHEGCRLVSAVRRLFGLAGGDSGERAQGRIVPVYISRAEKSLAIASDQRSSQDSEKGTEWDSEEEGNVTATSTSEALQAGPSHNIASGLSSPLAVDVQSTDQVNMCFCIPSKATRR